MSIRRRKVDRLRPVKIEPNVAEFAEGSALIHVGKTQVRCTASVEEGLPRWRDESEGGWVTAEYSMLPRATFTRSRREVSRGKVSGRTAEIQRLIGRSLRAVVDFPALGPRSIVVDCDVLQADGGTRTAAITGGYVALALACHRLLHKGLIERWPLRDSVGAVSVGLVESTPLLDLEYTDDVRAEVDMNVVMTGRGHFVEVQGTGEERSFTQQEFDRLLKLARKGIRELSAKQQRIVKAPRR